MYHDKLTAKRQSGNRYIKNNVVSMISPRIIGKLSRSSGGWAKYLCRNPVGNIILHLIYCTPPRSMPRLRRGGTYTRRRCWDVGVLHLSQNTVGQIHLDTHIPLRANAEGVAHWSGRAPIRAISLFGGLAAEDRLAVGNEPKGGSFLCSHLSFQTPNGKTKQQFATI